MSIKTRKTPTATIASIQGGQLFFEDAYQCPVDSPAFAEIIGDGYTNSIRLISLDSDYILNVWVTLDAKIKEALKVEMTLRREVRGNKGHWYAYRRTAGKLHKRYVGDDESLSQSKLLAVAQRMPSV